MGSPVQIVLGLDRESVDLGRLSALAGVAHEVSREPVHDPLLPALYHPRTGVRAAGPEETRRAFAELLAGAAARRELRPDVRMAGRLRQARERRGLDVATAAAATGIPAERIVACERPGDGVCTPPELRAMADAYGLPASVLCGIDGPATGRARALGWDEAGPLSLAEVDALAARTGVDPATVWGTDAERVRVANRRDRRGMSAMEGAFVFVLIGPWIPEDPPVPRPFL
jgi:hypothetical protein